MPSEFDEVLEHIVKRAEETDAGLGVTLCVNGLIIAGDVIRSARYFDKAVIFFNEMSITTNDPTEKEIASKHIQHFKQFLQQKGKSSEERHNPKYIHLDSVVMYPSDPQHPFGANIWRGKLSSVDAFSLGYGSWKARDVEDVSD
jgi:hypothetical protein